MKVLFSTMDYHEHVTFDEIQEDVKDVVIKYAVNKKGDSCEYVGTTQRHSPRYGWIAGHGKRGFVKPGKRTVADSIMHLLANSRNTLDFAIGFNEDGELITQFHDHDGYHEVVWKYIRKEYKEPWQSIKNFEWEVVKEYIENSPSAKVKKATMKIA